MYIKGLEAGRIEKRKRSTLGTARERREHYVRDKINVWVGLQAGRRFHGGTGTAEQNTEYSLIE